MWLCWCGASVLQEKSQYSQRKYSASLEKKTYLQGCCLQVFAHPVGVEKQICSSHIPSIHFGMGVVGRGTSQALIWTVSTHMQNTYPTEVTLLSREIRCICTLAYFAWDLFCCPSLKGQGPMQMRQRFIKLCMEWRYVASSSPITPEYPCDSLGQKKVILQGHLRGWWERVIFAMELCPKASSASLVSTC